MATKQSILALFQEKCWFNIPASSLICSLLLSMFAKTNAVIITFQRTISTFFIFCHVKRTYCQELLIIDDWRIYFYRK